MANDILRELTVSEMCAMRDICAQNYPYCVRGYAFLRYQIEWIAFFNDPENIDAVQRIISGSINRKVFTKRDGKFENCTVVSISRDDNLDIISFSRDPDELAECIRKTRLINWECGPQFVSHEGPHCQQLQEILKEKNIEGANLFASDGYVLNKSESLKFDIKIPDGFVLEKLEESDAKIVDHYWPYSYPGSYDYLRSLIILNESAGIFKRATRELVAWILINDQFATGCLTTRPEFQRKGFASLLIKYISKQVAIKYNEDAIAYIIQGNQISESCYQKLGFKRVDMENPGYVWHRLKRPIKN